ncbi:hypothetical protein NDU88_007921 [Pleurodeles waltl]|uniref:Uncharacterized protein n=1 Tax=Pleurodeles waltl TaxID=8319 RepID=A0AAV7NUG0_PLEWA|nr:hypothetical protein NDU88_007921 [Pleurodeles waltl]
MHPKALRERFLKLMEARCSTPHRSGLAREEGLKTARGLTTTHRPPLRVTQVRRSQRKLGILLLHPVARLTRHWRSSNTLGHRPRSRLLGLVHASLTFREPELPLPN